MKWAAGIVDWTTKELKAMGRKSRKLMVMNGALHLQAVMGRLYVTRGESQ